MGAERKSQYIGDKEKLMTAYHEVSMTMVKILAVPDRHREDTPLLRYTPKEQCPYTK